MQENMYIAPLPPQLSDSNEKVVQASGQMKRVYQVWQGNNIFFLAGTFIFGPDAKSMILTILLIVIPVVLFAAFVSQRLVNEFQHHLGNLIVGIAVVFTIYVIFLLLLTSSRDPGIIPRNKRPPELEDDDVSNLSWAGSHGGLSSVPPFKDVIVNGYIIRVKYCHTCMLYRPPRCSHCSICNNCVDRFDHHCPWVGQCIGKRNYRCFYMFVSSATILCLYVLVFCCVNLKRIIDIYECNLLEALLKSPVSGILILYTFVVVWFVGGLTGFHTYLICSNQTTYENFRYRYDGKINPYSNGCGRNVKEILFSRIPKSKNDFRAKVEEDVYLFPSLSFGRAISQDTAKTSFDLEMGGKCHELASEELEDAQSQINSVVVLERCATQPLHTSLGSFKETWEVSPDFNALSNEFRLENVFKEGEKI